MPYADYANLTPADYENLPPLVAKGEDREAKLNAIVQAWATQTKDLVDERGSCVASHQDLAKHPATLHKVALRDDNFTIEEREHAINLAHLLEKLSQRLAEIDSGKRNSLSRPVVALLGCQVYKCISKCLLLPSHLFAVGCHFESGLSLRKSHFLGAIDCSYSRFSDDAIFSGTIFDFTSIYRHTLFEKDAKFGTCKFMQAVDFTESRFRQNSYFSLTVFRRHADYNGAHFRNADFIRSRFFEKASFDKATVGGMLLSRINFNKSKFYGEATFGGSTFACESLFKYVRFYKYAYFTRNRFRGQTFFDGTHFADDADFRDTVFFRYVDFRRTRFTRYANFKNSHFVNTAYLRDSKFGRAIHLPKHGRVLLDRVDCRLTNLVFSDIPLRFSSRRWKTWTTLLTDVMTWTRVRTLGRLQALTRVSYASLVVVPVLAALWPAVRGVVQRYNDLEPATPLSEFLPLGWLLAYLGALAVALGHLVYQLKCPETVRRFSLRELTARAEEQTRHEAGEIRDERLRIAVDQLRRASDKLPHRHNAWLVRRGKRTVWLPHELDWYREPEPKETDAEAPVLFSAEDVESETHNEADELPAEEKRTHMDQETNDKPRTPEVAALDRRRIAVEEGIKAEYDAIGFEERFWALLSGGFYLMGGWFVLAIVLLQVAAVAEASGHEGWLWFYVEHRRPLLLLGSVVLALVFLVVLPAITPRYDARPPAALDKGWMWLKSQCNRLVGWLKKRR